MAVHPAAGGRERTWQTVLKRWLRPALQLLSLLLFVALLWYGGTEVWRQILDSDYRLLLVAFVWTGVANMVSAYRLQIVSEALSRSGRDEPAGWSRYFHLNMTARALGLFLPRGVSIFGGKTVGLRALGISVRRAVLVVLLDNLLDVLLLAALVVPGLLYLRSLVSSVWFWLLAAGAVLLLGGVIGWLTAQRRWQRPLGWLRRWPWLAARLPLEVAWEAGEMVKGTAVWRAYALTVLLNLLLGLQYYWIAAAIRLPQPAVLFLAAFPLTQLSLIVAIAPGGLGIFDLSWYGLLLVGGMADSAATTFVIAQRAAIFVFVLLWAGISALLSMRRDVQRQ